MSVRLPELAAGDLSWRLPVSAVGAAGLVCIFTADPGPHRRRLAFRLLSDEPSLAIWVACRFPSHGPPAGLAPLADWFADQPLSVLEWSAEQLAGSWREPAEHQERWAQLAATSIARAHQACAASQSSAATSPDPIPDTAAQQAFLLGLLAASDDWLRASGSEVSWSDVQSGRTCLPNWLVEHLTQLKGEGDSSPAAAAATEAIHSQGAGGGKPGLDEAIRRRWLPKEESLEGFAELVPLLAVRLSRLERLESEFARTLEQEKLSSLRELAYGASHEINNPLANISTRAQTLLRDEADPQRKKMLATINDQAFRAHEMISDMMLFAKPPQMKPESIVLSELIDSVVDEVAPGAQAQRTEIHVSLPDSSLSLHADRDHMTVALKALLRNALEAVAVGGRVEVSARSDDLPAEFSPHLEIAISDTGPGIEPEVRRHLFDPFYSGREAGRGLGFGLSKCWRIVTLHGGWIDVDSAPERGATFRVCLPSSCGLSEPVPERRGRS